MALNLLVEMTSVSDQPDTSRLRKSSRLNHQQPYSGVPTDEYNDGKKEKSWQRVYYEITRKGIHLYEPVKSVPNLFILLVLGLYLLLGFLTQVIEDDLPRVITDASIARDDWQTFSEEAALRYLNTILGGQPRVAGTKFHLDKTKDLKDLVDSVASQATQRVRTDWQLATGDFWMNFSSPFVNYYQNASNIIAVIEGESGFNSDGSTRASLLVNCHYDSVPFAEGASDNGVFCATMMEVLSRLSRRKDQFKLNIVFLFNGAEENPLQASHAFLQHPWARGVTTVVNLDSAGMNGKPSVFQVTDPRLLREYRLHSRRPSAQGVGEFLFTTGIIPSDTDFRVFRDFGQIQGIDVAFTKWGHVYHTRNDRAALVKQGVLQGSGEMLLPLVASAADRQQLQTKIVATSAVYFDFLNLFMVSLSYPVSHTTDVLVGLTALLTVLYYTWLVGSRLSTFQELLWSVLGRVCCLATGLVFVAVLVPIMVATTVQMRYLTQPWIVVPLFWLPYLVGTIIMAHIFDAWRTKKSGLNRSIRALQAMAATRLLLAVILIVMACTPPATPIRYVVAVPLFIMSIGAGVSLTLVRYVRMKGWQHLLLELIFTIPSLMFLFCLSLRLNAMMLPIMARSAGNYPDYTVAMINAGMAVLCCMPVSGIELLFSRRRMWLPLSAILAACVVLMFIPFSPFDANGVSTQRHYWFHSEIVSYNAQKQPTSRTSGVLITKHDPYSIQRVERALANAGVRVNAREVRDQCSSEVYCGVPLYRVTFGRFLPEALFLYTDPPKPIYPTPDVTLLNRTCSANNCTYDFEVTVAPHNLLTLHASEGSVLSRWSLSSPLAPSFSLQDRPVYVVVYTTSTYSEELAPLRFSVDMIVPESLQSQPALELSHHAHLIHHPEEFTNEYKALMAAMPDYFNIASFLSVRSNYVF